MNRSLAIAFFLLPIGLLSLPTKSVTAADIQVSAAENQVPLVAQRYDDRREFDNQNRRDVDNWNNRESRERDRFGRREVRREPSRRVWIPGHWEAGFLGIGRKWVEGRWETR